MSWALLAELAPFLAPTIVAALGAGGWVGLRRGRAESAKTLREADGLAQSIYRDALASAREEITSLRSDWRDLKDSQRSLRGRVDGIEGELRRERSRHARAVAEVVRVYSWVNSGSPPPPPRPPGWALALMEDEEDCDVDVSLSVGDGV